MRIGQDTLLWSIGADILSVEIRVKKDVNGKNVHKINLLNN